MNTVKKIGMTVLVLALFSITGLNAMGSLGKRPNLLGEGGRGQQNVPGRGGSGQRHLIGRPGYEGPLVGGKGGKQWEQSGSSLNPQDVEVNTPRQMYNYEKQREDINNPNYLPSQKKYRPMPMLRKQ